MPYDAAIVGYGNSGIVHAEVLDSISESSVCAVCDPDKSKRESAKEKFDCQVFPTTRALLDSVEPDAVHICSPVQTHYNSATECAERQIPTLIEKPLTLTVSETRKLIQARDDASIPMGVVHNRQFTHLMTKARKQISNDGIGDIIAIDLVASMRANLSDATRGEWVFNLPGGELGETLPHHVYLALSFVNRLGEIRGVTTHNSMDYDQVDIDGLTLVATDSTGQVNISIKILTNSSLKYELTLYGTNGIMTVDLRNTPGLYLNETSGFSPKTVLKNYAHNIKQLIIESANLIKYKSKERYSRQETAAVEHKSHYKTIQQFISSVEGGKQVPFTLEEGLDTIKVIQALKNRE